MSGWFSAVDSRLGAAHCFRQWRFGLGLLLFSSVAAAAPVVDHTAAPGQPIRFWKSTQGEAELNLLVDKQPLAQVLAVIAAKSQAQLHYAGMTEQAVSVNCIGADLKAILNCLLGEQSNIVYRYKSGDSSRMSPLEIWILSADGVSSNLNLETDTVDGSQTSKLIFNIAVEDRTEILLQQVKQAKHRVQAIAELANEIPKADGQVHKVLQQALQDENPQVRAQAVFALAKREGDAAQPELMQAFRDANPEVRMMVVENSDNDAALLAKAVEDDDPQVRQVAAGKLAALQHFGKF